MSKLHVDSVMKSFHLKPILTDIFISCQKGDIIGLLGRNGSGKSTLLKIIFGSENGDSQFVRVGDKIVSGLFDNRHLIKYLAQDSFLPNHIKVNTIIELFCDSNSTARIKQHHLVSSILHKKSHQLSGGEKRMLEILLIVLSDVPYVLIDEPFNGLSPIYKEEVKAIIREQSQNKGFLVTDHDYRNILDISNRVVLIHDGGTKEIKSKSELVDWGYIPKGALDS